MAFRPLPALTLFQQRLSAPLSGHLDHARFLPWEQVPEDDRDEGQVPEGDWDEARNEQIEDARARIAAVAHQRQGDADAGAGP